MDEVLFLKKAHRLKKSEIEGRLADFKVLSSAKEPRIFEELCFCLLTPGAKAENCKKIIEKLKENKLLFKGHKQALWPFLKYARFYNQKACRLISARDFFSKGECIKIKEKVLCRDPFCVRDWLVENVNGLGYKEASHFLRNIGRGEDLAILDRHVLKRLKGYGVIEDVPKSLTRKRYLEVEEKMREFSIKIKIPLSHLDLLFFSVGTGQPIKNCK